MNKREYARDAMAAKIAAKPDTQILIVCASGTEFKFWQLFALQHPNNVTLRVVGEHTGNN